MRIEVIDNGGLSTAQARAYAEYRLFATLARHARVIRTVRVILEQVERKGAADGVTCAVEVVLEPSGCVRARANGRQAHGAIDAAAERIETLINRRAPQAIQS
ncbi:MAG TPA: HPF/RaiA family ribosome-associated protein [Vicinamibacterales bacterium]|nr:HPF/RaiA family ribosome-associated protein [Vicinamibacterales bacterium]